MLKYWITAAWRIACITAALVFLAPLLPGIRFSGSLLSGVAIGGGLWLLFEASRFAVQRFYGLPAGSCPLPSVMRKLAIVYVVWSVLYVLAIGMLLTTPLHVNNVLSGLAGGVIALSGAIISNIFDRLFLPAPEKST